ncbi:MAG: type II secretion system protein [Sulfuricella sp.]
MMHSRKRGFSLVEMSIVLVIIGAIGMVLWKFIPNFKHLPAIARLTATSLDNAENALNGYILAHDRLPCPATTAGGVEDCGASGEWLPTSTLGLSLSEPVRYGVYRVANADLTQDADLASPIAKDRYTPLLPPSTNAVDATIAANLALIPDTVLPTVLPPAWAAPLGMPVPFVSQKNGLDFCKALFNVKSTNLTAGSQQVPIAYGLAVAGAGDADGDGSPFDGLNRSAGRFELGGAARSATYDDETRTVGAGELLTHMGCATRLSDINGAARATYAAYDIDRFAIMYASFRAFDLVVMQGNVDQADAGLVMASVGLAIAVAGTAIAVAQAVTDKGATAYVAAAGAFISTGVAAYGLAQAIIAKQGAEDALATAQSKLAPALAFQLLAEADFTTAAANVQALDMKGLLP